MRSVLHVMMLMALMLLPWVSLSQVTDYSCDFEDATENATWVFANGSAMNKWTVGTGVNNGGSHGLYISDGTNGAYHYTIDRDSKVFAYRSLNLVAGTYDYSYDWQCNGEGTYDYLRVAIAPASAEIVGGQPNGMTPSNVPQGWIAMDGSSVLSGTTSWTTRSGQVTIPSSGEYKLVFYWRNDFSNGIQGPAAIDNVSFSLPGCPAPADLVVSDVLGTSATVSWTAMGETGTWQVETLTGNALPGSGNGVVTTVNVPMVSLSDLSPNTEYKVYVKSVCGEESSSYTSITFRTACEEMTLPYMYGFEDVEEYGFPQCWHELGGGVYVDKNSPYNELTPYGERALMMNSDGVVATPYIPLSANMISLDFMLMSSGFDAGSLGVYFATSLDDLSNMVGIDTITLMDEGVFHLMEYELSFIESTEQGYIVFKNIVPYTAMSSYYIDQVNISELSQCRRPAMMRAEQITHHSAVLRWDEVMGATEYEVVYGLVNDVESTANIHMDNVVGDEVMIDDLVGATEYYSWVRTLCGSEYSEWRSGTPFTTQVSCAQVMGVSVDNVNMVGMALSWQYAEGVGVTATETEVGWKSATDAEFTTVVTDHNYYIIQGLASSTNYTIRLRTICGTDTAEGYTTHVATDFYGKFIGGGTSTSQYIPTACNYNYSYAQMIYPASDLTGLDTIRSIAFRQSRGNNTHRTWDVYMGNIKRSRLTSTTYVGLDSLTLVGDGVEYVSGTGWRIVQLTTPFVYHSDSNLVVAIDDNTGSWVSGNYFYMHPGFTLSRHVDGSNINPTSPGHLDAENNSPDIAFALPYHEGMCVAPLLTKGATTSSSVQLVWNATAGAQWQVEYKLPSEEQWTVAESGVVDTTVVVNNLSSGTMYKFRVGVQCDGEMKYATVEAFTACAAVAVPYAEEFGSDELNPCWMVGSVNDGSIPHISMDALYMGGSEGGYVILPEFVDEVATLHTTFDMKSNRETVQLAVLVGSNPNDYGSFEVLDTITIVNSNNTYVPQEYSFSDYAGAGHYIAFQSLTQQIYVDNLLVETAPMCSYPAFVEVSNIASESATISWRGVNDNTMQWLVLYNVKGVAHKDTVAVEATEHSCVLTDLFANTDYEVMVQNICSEDTVSALQLVTFRTECGEITLPYSENFETTSTGDYHPCWHSTNMHEYDWNYSQTPTISDVDDEHGTVMEFSDNVNMITPLIPVSPELIRVSFDAKVEDIDYAGKLAIGYTPSATDISEAVYVDTITFSNTAWNHYSVSFENLTVTGEGYVIFNNFENTIMLDDYGYENYFRGYIDNVMVEGDFGCEPVTNVTINNVTTTGADIEFEDRNNIGNYTIGYSLVNDINNITSSVNSTSTTYTLSGLLSGTRYYIWVRSNCVSGNSSWSEGPTFVTLCDAMNTLPYEENFDSYTTDVVADRIPPHTYPNHTLPTCWTFLNMSDSTYKQPHAYLHRATSSYNNYADSATCLLFYSKANTSIFAVLPEFTTHVSSLQISFTYRSESDIEACGTLSLGVLTDRNDTSTYQMLCEYPRTNVLTEVSHNFALDGLDGSSDYVIAFRYKGGTSSRFYTGLDNVVVKLADDCGAPEMLIATDITANEATISWKGSGDNYNVQYKLTTDTSWTYSAMTTDTVVYLDNLVPMTDYQVRVQSVCGGNESAWSEVLMFSTVCGRAAIPYSEDFNSYTSGIAYATAPPTGYPNQEMPMCWSFPIMKTTNPKVFMTSYAAYTVTGNSLFFISSADCPVYGIMPEMDADLNQLTIGFSYRNENLNTNNSPLILGVMTDPTDTATFRALETFPIIGSMTHVEHSFENDIFSIDSTYHIAFKYGGRNGNFMYMSIDDVVVDYTPSCVVPSLPNLVLLTSSSATLDWTGSASSYEFQYKLTTEMGWTSIETGMNSIAISGLNITTEYQARVRAICGTDDTSRWSDVICFTTPCDPYPLPFTEDFTTASDEELLPCWNKYEGLLDEIIAGTDDLSAGGMWKFADNRELNDGGRNAYIDIWGHRLKSWLVTPSIDINVSASLEFDMARYDYGGNTVWSADDKFVVLVSGDYGNTWTTVKSWIGNEFENIPIYSDSVNHVAISLNQFYGDTVRIAFYGESTIEGGDHYIYIDNLNVDETDLATTCDAPTNLMVSHIMTTSAELAWQGTAPSYDVEYRIENSESWTTVNTDQNSYVLNDLQRATTYEWRVRSNCGTETSTWATSEFSTLVTCVEVSNVAVSDITETTAKVTWSAGGDESAWEIVYGEDGFDYINANATVVNTLEYELNGLISNTQYDVYVRAICGENFYSAWSDKVSFKTLEVIPEGIDGVEGNFQFAIYPNPTSGSTTISLNGVEGKVIISVVDMNGRMVKSELMECLSDCEKRMDVSGLNQGTYFVRVLGDDINSVRKLIVK